MYMKISSTGREVHVKIRAVYRLMTVYIIICTHSFLSYCITVYFVFRANT